MFTTNNIPTYLSLVLKYLFVYNKLMPVTMPASTLDQLAPDALLLKKNITS